MFGAFIFLCGTTHLVGIWTVWSGTYGVQGLVKLATAGVSVATAVALWPVIPKLLELPSPDALATSNRELRREIDEREQIAAELREVGFQLEYRVRQRTAALEAANAALRREVAERERAEERFRGAVESSPAGMLMVDSRGAVALANRAAEAIFGYARGELVGAPVETVVPERFRSEHPLHRATFLKEPRVRAMGAGRVLFGRRKDGTEVPIEIGLNPIRTEEGVFVLSSVVDTTERARSARTIQEKTRQLERSNRELEEFAHVVSHDLKAPLRGIVSLASWITEDCRDLLPVASRDHLELLANRARRMSELIDGILRYSRIERSEVGREWLDSDEVAREVVEFLAPPASVRIRIESLLPRVYYDRTQLLQVFQNLIGNAIQHLGKPEGEIVVSGEERDDGVEFTVRDDGVGIDERHFQRIFRIFQSLDPDTGSSGIGLAIVKKIVESHDGTVVVESQRGTGTTFRFSVPKAAQDASSPGGSLAG
jgi:PAS domain S-box-containing protein